MNKILSADGTPYVTKTVGGEPFAEYEHTFQSIDFAANIQRKLGSWAGIAAEENGKRVSGIPYKIYVEDKQTSVTKTCLYKTKKLSRKQKAYLKGQFTDQQGKTQGSSDTVQKNVHLGQEFVELIGDHPIKEILSHPNAHYTGAELIQATIQSLQLTGNAFWHIEKTIVEDEGNLVAIPSGLWLLPSMSVSLVFEDHVLIGYTFGKGANDPNPAFIGKDQMIHLRNRLDISAPCDLGVSCYHTVWKAIGLHESKRQMDMAFYNNQARPDILLYAKEGMTMGKEAMQRFQQDWISKFQGPRKTAQVAVVPSGVGAEVLNIPDKIVGDYEIVITEICKGFGYPKTMMMGDANRANATQADYGWMTTTIVPYLHKIEEAVNCQLAPMFQTDEVVMFAYDNPIPIDRVFEENKINNAWTSGKITLNEARLESGYEEVDGPMGEMFYTQATNPFGDFGVEDEEIPANTADPEEQHVDNTVRPLEIPNKETSKSLTVTKAKSPALNKGMAQIYTVIKKFLRQQKSDLAIDIYSKVKSWESVQKAVKKIDLKSYNDKLSKDLQPAVNEIMQKQAAHTMRRLKGKRAPVIEAVKKAAEKYSLQVAKQINKTTSGALNKIIDKIGKGVRDGSIKGQLMPTLKREIDAYYQDTQQFKAKQIAITETNRAINKGTHTAAVASGKVKGFKWATRSVGACKTCKKINGRYRKIGKSFVGTVQHPPLHPNCRCRIKEVLK